MYIIYRNIDYISLFIFVVVDVACRVLLHVANKISITSYLKRLYYKGLI